jgi:ABC-type transport system involved in cytochrome c biogenesis permease component
MAACLAVIIVGSGFLIEWIVHRVWGLRGSPRTLGMPFPWILGMAVIFTCFSSVALAGAALRLELNEGILNLVLLTPIREWEVIAGKVVAAWFENLYCVASVIPVYIVVLAYQGAGVGVSLRFIATACLLALLVGAFSIYLATGKDRVTWRGLMMATGLLSIWVAPLILYAYLAHHRVVAGHRVPIWLLDLIAGASPISASLGLFEGLSGMWGGNRLVAAGSCVIWTLIFVWLGGRGLARRWREDANVPMTTNAKGRGRLERWLEGPDERRRTLRQRILDVNPYQWRLIRADALGRRFKMGLLVSWLVAPPILLGMVYSASRHLSSTFVWVFAVTRGAVFHNRLRTQLASEVISGGLLMVLGTRVSVQEIFESLRLAGQPRFRAFMASGILLAVVLCSASYYFYRGAGLWNWKVIAMIGAALLVTMTIERQCSTDVVLWDVVLQPLNRKGGSVLHYFGWAQLGPMLVLGLMAWWALERVGAAKEIMVGVIAVLWVVVSVVKVAIFRRLFQTKCLPRFREMVIQGTDSTRDASPEALKAVGLVSR